LEGFGKVIIGPASEQCVTNYMQNFGIYSILWVKQRLLRGALSDQLCELNIQGTQQNLC
jgi:hypothetical protein